MLKQLKKEVEKELKRKDKHENLPLDIPRDPQEFYEDFGFLPHPYLRDENNEPVMVKELTPYQREFWAYDGNALAIKSQKIGLTTSSLLEIFQFTLLPEGAGKDVLVIAQNQLIANDHCRTLKQMIFNSAKYNQFLLVRAEHVFKEEKTKSSVIFIKNPYNKKKPSRIIFLGSSELSVWSWKNIGMVYMSDVAKLDIKDQPRFFAAVFSRLANTRGIIKIETPPNGQQGEVFNIYNKSKTKYDIDPIISETFANDPNDSSSKFKVFEYSSQLAVKAGIISQEFLDQERHHLGDALFSQFYECSFLPSGNQWYNQSMIFYASYGVCA